MKKEYLECSFLLQMILQYFKLFLNLPNDDIDTEDGTIDPKDFREKLESTKSYSK